jgi:hypothetical protein
MGENFSKQEFHKKFSKTSRRGKEKVNKPTTWC